MNVVNTKKKNVNTQAVQVFIRPRPLNVAERSGGYASVIQNLLDQKITVRHGSVEKSFQFDKVFHQEASQKYVYETVVAPLIESCISGYNCTVFAYGQTGTGKTHTMTGQDISNLMDPQGASVGIIPRALDQLFDTLATINPEIEFTVRVSFIEIYNEDVRDLLAVDPTATLRIYDDRDNKGSICIRDLREATVCNTKEALMCLQAGTTERHTAATKLNVQSSRSHTLFTITVHTRQITVDGDEIIKTGKLNLVDLAGSENIGRSGATEARAREAGTINKSLLTLGKVIKALAQKLQHIPYRDSKLTRILQDSLGGKTKTCMIAMISPAVNAWDETLSTLDYANVARCVSNCPQVNENRNKGLVLTHFKDEIAKLQRELAASRAGEGFYISHESYNTMNMELEQQRENITEKKRREIELMSKIKEMQDWRIIAETHQEELKASFDRTKAYLQEKEVENKKHEYLYEHVEKKYTELEKKAHNLLKNVKVLKKNESVYHKIYKNRCDISMKNASTAERISNSCKMVLAQLQSDSDKLYDKQHENLVSIQNCNESTTVSVSGASSRVKQVGTNLSEVADEDFEFYSTLNVCGMASEQEALNKVQNISNYFEPVVKQIQVGVDESAGLIEDISNTVQEGAASLSSSGNSLKTYFGNNLEREEKFRSFLTEHGQKKFEEAKELSIKNSEFKQSLQALKNQLNRMVDSMIKKVDGNAERLQLHSSGIDNFIASSKEYVEDCSWRSCPSLVQEHVEKEQILLDSFVPQVNNLKQSITMQMSTIEETVKEGAASASNDFWSVLQQFNEAATTRDTKIKKDIRRTGCALAAIQEDLDWIKKYARDSDIATQSLQKYQKTFYSDLTKFNRDSIQMIENDLKENVDRSSSAGETPVRQMGRVTETITPRTPKQILIERFEQNHLDADISDDVSI